MDGGDETLAGKGTGKILSRSTAGFTLLELLVVIFIISLAAGIVFPRLPDTEATKLKNSARNLGSGLRFLNDQAIVTKKAYRLHLNLNDNSTRITQLSPSGEELQPEDQFMNRRLVEEGIDIEDVNVPSLGLVTEGEVTVSFGPGGIGDGLTIHLKGGEKNFTVIAYPSGGKVKVLEGRQEVDS